MQFTDAAVVAGTRRREDGYLVADARIARTGVQLYLGHEVGKAEMATVRVYRPGEEVFSPDTLRSAAHRPVTNDHPADLVTSQNWRQHAVGQTGDEVAGEGIFIRVPLMVSDEAAIRDIEAGKRELSAGYTCDLDWTGGHGAEHRARHPRQPRCRGRRGRLRQGLRAGHGGQPGRRFRGDREVRRHRRVDITRQILDPHRASSGRCSCAWTSRRSWRCETWWCEIWPRTGPPSPPR